MFMTDCLFWDSVRGTINISFILFFKLYLHKDMNIHSKGKMMLETTGEKQNICHFVRLFALLK